MKHLHLLFVTCAASLALHAQAGATTVVGRIPKQDGYVTLQMDLNGKPHEALFDACELFLKLNPKVQGATSGERVKVDVGSQGETQEGFASKSLNWMIGSQPIPPTWTLEDRLETTITYTGSKVVAVLGLRALGSSVLELNFDQSKVLLAPPGSGASFKNKLPIVGLDGMPGLKLKVHQNELSFFVATASNDTLSLPAKLFDDLVRSQVILLYRHKDAGSAVNNQLVNERQGWFLSGELMGKNLRGVSVDRVEGDAGEMGLQWLRNFNCAFDLGSAVFSYEARTNPKPPVNWQAMLGAVFEYSDGSVRTWGVRKDSAADKAGLKKGDAILQFGGIRADQLNVEVLSELIAESAGKTVSCEVRRGTPGEVIKMGIPLGKFESLWDFGGRTTE